MSNNEYLHLLRGRTQRSQEDGRTVDLILRGIRQQSREGFTTSKDTWVCSMTVGERYENNASNTAVKDRIGAR
jgi:hypothetical protein